MNYEKLTKVFLELGMTTFRSGLFETEDPPELLELFNEEFSDVEIPGLVAPEKRNENFERTF